MSPIRLAFGYEARSGKSEAVNYLTSKYGGMELSFAKAVYDILHYAQNRCGFSLEKDRKFLQMMGDWGRNKESDVWANIVKEEIDRKSQENIYISDVRYPNEAAKLKDCGFILINIIRDPQLKSDDFGSGSKGHSSETSMENYNEWDFVIYNNKTLSEFHQQLDNIINKIITTD